MNEHYVGYGLEVDGAMEPWLSGSLRKTSNDGPYYTIAKAKTPEKLVNSARKKIGFDESKIRINTKDQTDEEKIFILNESKTKLELIPKNTLIRKKNLF